MQLSDLTESLISFSEATKAVPIPEVITFGWSRGVIRKAIQESNAFTEPALVELRDYVLTQCSDAELKLAFDGLALQRKDALKRLRELPNENEGITIGTNRYPSRIVLAAFAGAMICVTEPKLICNRLQISQAKRTMTNVRRHLASWILQHVRKYST